VRSRPFSVTPETLSLSSADRGLVGARNAAIPRFFTVQQVADLAEVSTRTVRRWIESKLLVAHRINGLVRISETDLRAFLASHRDL
jgi:excisionase family DNA binding protein